MITTHYLDAIESELQTGNATEHSYRHILRQFLVEWDTPSPSAGGPPLPPAGGGIKGGSATDYHITNEPKHNARNAPDFLVRRGEVSLGWIETKPPGTNLDTEETSEQLQRYRKAFPNLILTDYLEFRLYTAGEHRLSVRLAALDSTTKRLLHRNTDNNEVSLFLTAFFGAEPPQDRQSVRPCANAQRQSTIAQGCNR